MNTVSTATRTPSFAILVAIVAAGTAIATALSLGLPLFALTMRAQGHAATWIGLGTAMAGLAALVVTPMVPPLARRAGALPLLTASIVVAAVAFFGFHAAESLSAWFGLRLVFHAALAAAYVLSEFWVTGLAPPDRRGLWIGIHSTAFSVGLALGPMILATVGSTGALPFAIGAVVLAAALVPVALARAHPPPFGEGGDHSLLAIVATAPAATFGALVFGAFEAGGLAILPLWALAQGLDETTGAAVLTAIGLGNVVLQIPFGRLADRMDKMRLLTAIAAVGLLGALALPAATASIAGLMVLVFLWGGTIGGLYTVGLAELGARHAGSNLAAANAAFIFMYSAGMLIGPATYGAGFDAAATWGLPIVLALGFAVHLGLIFVLGRQKARRTHVKSA